jgi:hypothetical protein
MLTAIAAALILAAPVADAPDRFDHTRTNEAQRAMLASFTTARELVSGTYNWASSSVTLDRYIAQQKALDISKQVRATEAEWTRMAGGLSSAQANQVKQEVTTIRDLLGQAQLSATKLSTEAGAASPNRMEVRHLTAGLYGALALAHEHQIALGKKLGLSSEQATTDRAR